MLILPDY